MTERFTYAPDLAQQMRREAMRRVGFWSLFVAVFWSGGIVALIDERSWLGPLIALGATGIVVVFESVLRQVAHRTRRLLGQSLEYDGRILRQVSAEGSLIGEIDLSAPFTVSYPHSAGGNAVYQVTQDARSREQARIEFSSRIIDGERIVRDLLRHDEWPPGANAT